MDYSFSKNINDLKPSAIREILKLSSQPGIIPFSAGNPASEAFPTTEISKISKRLFEEDPSGTLQYSVTEGYLPLREHLKNSFTEEGLFSEDDDIIITSGAQQVMNLTAKTLADRGDAVICEDPSFIGSLNAFRSFGLKLIGIPLEKDGINIEALENSLKTNKNVRFIYTIPNFQNPSGVTMSLKKRKAILDLAVKYNVLILEDNPYGDLRFAGENINSIKSLDTTGNVIYAGSFSKVLAPGIRVGYTIANSKIISKMTVCKQTDDVHTNLWAQKVAFEFLTKYDFNVHLEKIREIYRRKAELCMSLIDKYLLPKGVEYYSVEGGLFIWCSLPNGVNMNDFVIEALNNKVAVVPGDAFSVDESKTSNRFRINFSTPSDEEIKKGIEILGKML